MAKAIGDNLQDAGFKEADVTPADAAPATVEVTQEPVIQASQPIGGASFEQAQTDDFQVRTFATMTITYFPPTTTTPPSTHPLLNIPDMYIRQHVVITKTSSQTWTTHHSITPTLPQPFAIFSQDAFCAAVGGQLGVDPKDVQVTDVVVDDHGAVTMSYQGESCGGVCFWCTGVVVMGFVMGFFVIMQISF